MFNRQIKGLLYVLLASMFNRHIKGLLYVSYESPPGRTILLSYLAASFTYITGLRRKLVDCTITSYNNCRKVLIPHQVRAGKYEGVRLSSLCISGGVDAPRRVNLGL